MLYVDFTVEIIFFRTEDIYEEKGKEKSNVRVPSKDEEERDERY